LVGLRRHFCAAATHGAPGAKKRTFHCRTFPRHARRVMNRPHRRSPMPPGRDTGGAVFALRNRANPFTTNLDAHKTTQTRPRTSVEPFRAPNVYMSVRGWRPTHRPKRSSRIASAMPDHHHEFQKGPKNGRREADRGWCYRALGLEGFTAIEFGTGQF